MRRAAERGVTVVEFLVSVSVLLTVLLTLAVLLVFNSRVNGSQQLAMETQSNARNSVSLIVPLIRSAGWDPRGAGFTPVQVDPVNGSWIEVRADLNGDGDAGDPGEDVTIRFLGGRIERKLSADPTGPFELLADGISNDANGDGTVEPMFVLDDPLEPRRVTVRVTAKSLRKDPAGNRFLRRTAETDVIIRTRS